MLITGASATITSLTGMSPYAAHYLIPLTVTCYVLVGGMRSSLVADYLHSTCLSSCLSS
jgi:Na+/proline symporter